MRPLTGIALAIASLAVGALTPAQAADLQWRAPAPPGPAAEPPASYWSGFYLGGFAGGSFGGSSQGYSVSSAWVSANLPSLLPFVDGVGSQGLGLRGADLGLETGYDWRIDKTFVLGIAGDVNWSDLKGSRTTNGTLPLVQFPYTISQNLSSDWQGSLRARMGVTPVDNVLLYATAGLALGHFDYKASFWDQLEPPFLPGNEAESAAFRAWRPGWTAGGGGEWAFAHNWSVKGEYRFSEYAAVTGLGILPLQQPPSTAYIAHSSGRILTNELRAGVDYHFN